MVVSQGRIERIAAWVGKFDHYEQLDIAVSEILGRLAFDVKAERFEQDLDEISRAIGFAGERPVQFAPAPDSARCSVEFFTANNGEGGPPNGWCGTDTRCTRR